VFGSLFGPASSSRSCGWRLAGVSPGRERRGGRARRAARDEAGLRVRLPTLYNYRIMSGLIEAIGIKRKSYIEHEGAPYVCLDVEISRPTARGGQTLVRVKMRNLVTRAVFDRTFKAGEKFSEPDLATITASYLYADSAGYHFMDQDTFETLTLTADQVGDDRALLADNLVIQVQKFNGAPIGLQFPPIVELTVTATEPGVRGDTASGGVTKLATLETGLEVKVPLFIKEGEKVKVHTETREVAGRA
jgi:elongation factor P